MEDKIDKDKLLYIFRANKPEGRHSIARWLVQEYSIKTIDSRERESYIFRDGYYVPAVNFLRGEIEGILGTLSSNNTKTEIISKVQDMTIVKREEFESPIEYINVANGVYDIKAKEFLNHDPKYNFTYKLPIKYVPEADCPLIKNFLTDILQEENLPATREWLGFLLYRKYFIKKALIIVGPKDTGKTTFLNLVEAFIGQDNIAGVSLQKLASDRFSTANLYLKHANIYDDMSAKDITDNASFKMATGQSSMTGENKFSSQFKFTNYAKLMFSCNMIPNTSKMDDPAYYSRWIVLNFIKTAENPDTLLINKLTTKEELSGLFNFALEGLYKILESGKFSYTLEPFEIKSQMLRSGSPIARFAYEKLAEEIGEWISREEMYAEFIKFTQEAQMQAVALIEFNKQIQNYAGYIVDSKKLLTDTDGKARQKTGWRNVKLKGEEQENSEENIDGVFENYER